MLESSSRPHQCGRLAYDFFLAHDLFQITGYQVIGRLKNIGL